MIQGQFDPNNNDDQNNSPGPAYNGPADGAPGTTTILRQGPITKFVGTGNLTASRVWQFGTVLSQGWTRGDLVYLSVPRHTGTGFSVTVNDVGGTPLVTWAALVANGGAFWFNGVAFEPMIPGADVGSGGGAAGFWELGGNPAPTGPQSLYLQDGSTTTVGNLAAGGAVDVVSGLGTGISLGAGKAPPAPASGALQVDTVTGFNFATNGVTQVTGGDGGLSAEGGGAGGVSLGAGTAAPATAPGVLAANATTAFEFFGPGFVLAATQATPDVSAQLDVQSTTQGALLPRMTTTQRNAIPTPAKSLLIFNTTTNQFEYNSGTSGAPVWVGIATTAALPGNNSYFAWSITPLRTPVPDHAAFQFGTLGNGAAGSGQTVAGTAITQSGAGTFMLAPGTYQIDFDGSFTEAAQAVALLNGVILVQTEIGRSTGTSQLVGSWEILVPAGPSLSFEVHNHSSAAALTLTVLAGGTVAQAMTLRIVKIA